jgi:hypothetical protein
MYNKIAIGDRSKITNDTWLKVDLTKSGQLLDRCVHITNTRYPNLLLHKDSEDVIHDYIIGSSIT